MEEPEVKEINGQVFLIYSDRVDAVIVDDDGNFEVIKTSPIPKSSTSPTGNSSRPKGSSVYNTKVMKTDKYNYDMPAHLPLLDAKGNPVAVNALALENVQAQNPSGVNQYGNPTIINPKETKRIWKDYFTSAGWDPEDQSQITPDRVKEFQKFVNTDYEMKGLDPYFDETENFGVDSKWGPATANAPRPIEKKVDKVEEEVKDTIKDTPKLKVIPPVINTDAPNKWWLQDTNNLGLAMSNLAGIKRYPPWQATPDTRYAQPTFYDPSRALAANSEMINQGVQGAGTFNNQQAFAANFAQMQGQGAKQAADIIGNYDDRNVGVANQFEQYNNSLYNTASREKAGQATNLFDKYTILNQQYDNSKNQAKQQVVQALNQGYTNAAMTQNLNSIYDQYQIDPLSGGNLRWTQGRPLANDYSKSKLEEAGKFAQDWIGKNKEAGVSADKLMELYLKYNT